tara:strand:+ start:11438 stop:12640 length:1203 start_codon:yes stop_codon:yes gene_type:complete
MAGLGKYNISSYIDDLIPEHIQSAYPDLVEFLKVYALYLERSNKSVFYLNALDIQRDIDFIEDSLLTELQNEIGIAVPRDFATNPRMFYKRLVEFYRSRGTPESITSFFRMIYDDEVETYFPFVDILNPSDGAWTDQVTDIIADKSKFTPSNTFTISGTPTVVSGNNDGGQAALFDDEVVFVNDVYKTPTTDYVEEVYSDSGVTKYRLTFTSALANNDIVTTYSKGLFTTNDGFLSDKKFLQDSYYYQKFSYVLRTGKNIADWKNAFTRLVHPAGFKFFGEILINILALDQGNTQAQYGWLLPAGKINFNIGAFQVGPVSFNSNLWEISWTHIPFTTTGTYNIGSGGGRIGMWNHWDNMKFRYLGPNSDFSRYTVQDAINNNIGLQFGLGGASSLVQHTP